MSATSVLVVQHRTIGALFNDVVGETRRHARSRGVARLAEELIAHIVAEEAVFYPAVRRALRADGPGVGRSFAPTVLRYAAAQATKRPSTSPRLCPASASSAIECDQSPKATSTTTNERLRETPMANARV